MKPFLLIAGLGYQTAGTRDWKGTYSTHKEAETALKELCSVEEIDWYKIIDLREWIYG